MIKGVLVPNITIFDEQGNIDKAKTMWHMNWMLEKGVDGLFLTGSYGSGPLMTNDERKKIFIMAKKVTEKYSDKYLIAHVGCADTKSTIELSKVAEELDMDAIGAVPPFYYKYTEDRIVQYYKDIIDSVNIPVFAYNNPTTTRCSFTVDTVKKLQDVGLNGLKDSPINVGFLSSVYYDAKIQRKDFQVIIGTSTGWLPYYYMGIDTMIAGMCNYAPEIVVAMYNWTIKGEKEKAEKAYNIMLSLSKTMHFTDSTIVSHIGLYARGFEGGYPRKPMQLPPLNDLVYNRIKKEIELELKKLSEI